MLTFEQITRLIDIVCEKGLQGLEIERSDFRLKIDGRTGSAITSGEVTAVEPVAPVAEIAAVAPDGDEAQADDGNHTVKSPIVGTFYSAPSPDSDPYVEVGDEIKRGEVLCIVEAMKLMNEIESDIDGTVVEILGRNAQPVEYGEPLFIVKPA